MSDRDVVGAIVEVLEAASGELTAPGAPFEVHEEEVLGERMPVFRNRPRSLREVLTAGAAHGDSDHLIFDDGRRVSFTDLVGGAAQVARALRDDHGIRPGDRVAICAANGPEWILTFWATTAMGAVVVAMNGWWTGTEMRHALELSDPALLVIDEKRAARLDGDPGMPTVLIERDFGALWHEGGGGDVPEAGIEEDDPAMLLFTSGTTGRPKAAVLTHRGVIAYCMSQLFLGARGMRLADASGPKGGVQPGRRLAVFPLFHVSGLGNIVTGLMSGSTTVWPLGRFDAARVIELTETEGITGWGGASTHILRLLDELDRPERAGFDVTKVTQVGIGGSASTPELIRRTEERFLHLVGTFSSGYGSTESGGLASWAPNAMLAAAPDCVGPPLATIAVKIVDDAGEEVPEGTEGHICVRSPLVMKEYWRHPEANAETFLPGRWVRMGDVGRMEGGALFLASRKRDLILRGGENIYPFEIENRLDEHPDVTETAVFGVDHPVLGQEVKAVVVVRTGATVTAADLQAFCAEALSSYKVPAHVELRHEPLPRNATGKIMKHVLAGEGENTFVEE